jgi:glycosyltransferase involved in cell wall biosynthesis
LLPYFLRERQRVVRQCICDRTQLWFTYHSYYKGPDLLGPLVAGQANIPYVIFQGVFSTKRKRDVRTWPGYVLNKRALCAAQYVFTNKRLDLLNLKRLLPLQRISYVAPGIFPGEFIFNPNARNQMRSKLGIGDEPVVVTAAMFRPGVKAQGLEWVLKACGRLVQKGCRFHLLIAGDGKEKSRLLHLAEKNLGSSVHFVGKVSREKMHEFYSAGDIFVFPGIREGLGMVFLEAQSCGLPVVAFANEGIPEVVEDQVTGFLVPIYAAEPFDQAIEKLLADQDLRHTMGTAARRYVRDQHDLDKNYREMERVLRQIVGEIS